MSRGRGHRRPWPKRCRVRLRDAEWHVREVDQATLNEAAGETGNATEGLCVYGEGAGDNEILILETLPQRTELDRTLHEMLHACFYDLDESVVQTVGADMAKLLWRRGWRKAK